MWVVIFWGEFCSFACSVDSRNYAANEALIETALLVGMIFAEYSKNPNLEI